MSWKVCWNKGRLCWKIAKLFNFCHLKKLVRPETFGPYYVYRNLSHECIYLQILKWSFDRKCCDVYHTSRQGYLIVTQMVLWQKLLIVQSLILVSKLNFRLKISSLMSLIVRSRPLLSISLFFLMNWISLFFAVLSFLVFFPCKMKREPIVIEWRIGNLKLEYVYIVAVWNEMSVVRLSGKT